MSTSLAAEPPVLLIVAGPNGSGKSTVYQNADFAWQGRSVWIINPDLLAARISQVEAMSLPEANVASVVRIEAWLEASIKTHQTIGVETVLSTGKYRRLVTAAKALGFELWLLYVMLDSPDRNVERVKLRVLKGGHEVEEGKIRDRYKRSLDQLPWFLERADRAWIFDNSGADPRYIGEKSDGVIMLDEAALPAAVEAVSAIGTPDA
jgi:predicted ABC-type ATPase